MEFKEVRGSVTVPPNTGVEGFLHTIREILKKERVQSISIDAKGVVSFRFFALEEEAAQNIGIDFGALEPYYIIRNAVIQEVELPPDVSAAVAVSVLLDKAAVEHMKPVAFAMGKDSLFWSWYEYTTGHALQSRDQIFGLPVRADRQIPDDALLLCAGFGRDASFIDTRVSYKIEMQLYEEPLP